MRDAAQPRAWHRLPGETDSAREAFEAYLAQDPATRSLEVAAIETGHALRLCQRWAKLYNWPGRAKAYDLAHVQAPLQEALGPLREAFPRLAANQLANALLALRTGDMTPERTVRVITQVAKALGYPLDRS